MQNCAALLESAFWFRSCHFANLNGFYLGGSHLSYANGINWAQWEGLLLLAQRTHRDEDPPGPEGLAPYARPTAPSPSHPAHGSSAALQHPPRPGPRGSSWMSPSHPWHPPLGQAPAPYHPRLCCLRPPPPRHMVSPDSDPVPRTAGLCPTCSQILTAASAGEPVDLSGICQGYPSSPTGWPFTPPPTPCSPEA